MAFLAAIVPALFATAATVGVSKALSGGAGQQQAPQVATRNDALERAAAADSLARRTGARGQKKTPVGGAEASTGPKTSLLGRSA
ncbi:hypothetical protein [Novosphingobium sp.]|uniref:hypothetical protein n=1 Tax=Novosphingobium sp. TaxID=1874826 RepID=UPI00260B108D|nr:hypothetical protein [Novosphingobium sp.]